MVPPTRQSPQTRMEFNLLLAMLTHQESLPQPWLDFLGTFGGFYTYRQGDMGLARGLLGECWQHNVQQVEITSADSGLLYVEGVYAFEPEGDPHNMIFGPHAWLYASAERRMVDLTLPQEEASTAAYLGVAIGAEGIHVCRDILGDAFHASTFLARMAEIDRVGLSLLIEPSAPQRRPLKGEDGPNR